MKQRRNLSKVYFCILHSNGFLSIEQMVNEVIDSLRSAMRRQEPEPLETREQSLALMPVLLNSLYRDRLLNNLRDLQTGLC